MKSIVLAGIGKLQIVEEPKPIINNDTDVLLKVKSVGVCGSDVHYFETGKIGSQVVQYPYKVGHECAAVVEQVGSAVNSVCIGDRVAVEPAICCKACDQCKAGRHNTCRNLKFLGCPGQIDGCLCEYIVMPQECCLEIPNNMTFDEAVICEPFAIGVYAVQQSGLTNEQSILILGAGPIGLSCLEAAKAVGFSKSYITEIIPERLAAAQKSSGDWVGNPNQQNIVNEISDIQNGIDIAYECVGKQETIDQAVELLKPGGKLMLIGIPREDRVSFSIDKLRRKEITVINVRRQNHCSKKAIDLISSGQANLKYMATHHFTTDNAQSAFEMVANYQDGVIKAFLEFE